MPRAVSQKTPNGDEAASTLRNGDVAERLTASTLTNASKEESDLTKMPALDMASLDMPALGTAALGTSSQNQNAADHSTTEGSNEESSPPHVDADSTQILSENAAINTLGSQNESEQQKLNESLIQLENQIESIEKEVKLF